MDELFHYCGTDSFVSIVQTGTIRLSSLTSSNDSMEGRLVSDTVARLAQQAKLDEFHRTRLKSLLESVESNFDGLGFCLSEHGDVLSQWRGYANDASGVAIGFKRKFLEEIAGPEPFTGCVLQKVEYDPKEHEERLRPMFNELQQAIAEGALRVRELREKMAHLTHEEYLHQTSKPRTAYAALVNKCFALTAHQYLLKAPAFREEREWRLLSILINDSKDPCEYRTKPGRLIPYRVVNLPGVEARIGSVVLGPKHTTPPEVVRTMLERFGFPEVDVRRSSATYR